MYFLFKDERQGLRELGCEIVQDRNNFHFEYHTSALNVDMQAKLMGKRAIVAGVARDLQGRPMLCLSDVRCRERMYRCDSNSLVYFISRLLALSS